MKLLKFYLIFALAFAFASGAVLPDDDSDDDGDELVTPVYISNASKTAITTTTTTTSPTTPAPTTTTPRPIEDIDPATGQVYGYHVRVSDLELECTPTEKSVNEDVYVKRQEGSFGGQKLELFQKDQFQWTASEYKDRSLKLKHAVFAGFGADGGALFICRPVDSQQVGIVSLRDGHCRTVENGRSSAVTQYQLLTNPKKLKYRWEDIEDWSAVPYNAVSATGAGSGLAVGSKRAVNRPTFIGRVKSGTSGSSVMRMPSKRKVEDVLDVASGTFKEQILVVESTASEPDFLIKMKIEEKIETLKCQIVESKKASEGYEENIVDLKMIKMKNGGEVENKVHWQVFRKSAVSTTALFWGESSGGSLSMNNPVLGGLDADGLPRYLCQAEHRSTKIPGFLNLATGDCDVTYGHSTHEKSNYKVLYNPGNVPLVWKPFKTETRGEIGGIIGGRDDNTVYYFGKVVYNAEVRFGKVRSKTDSFYFGGTKEYEISAESNKVKILAVDL